MIDPWLPSGFALPDSPATRQTTVDGGDWQIVSTADRGQALLARPALVRQWCAAGLIETHTLPVYRFGELTFHYLIISPDRTLALVRSASGPTSVSQALAFAQALCASRKIASAANLFDAMYVEALGRILPLSATAAGKSDEELLAYWLTCGSPLSLRAFDALHRQLNWMEAEELRAVIGAAGFMVAEVDTASGAMPGRQLAAPAESGNTLDPEDFRLPGRRALEEFFREHVLDIVAHRERYALMGIAFPGGVVLHGPPGSGKTHAVDTLVNFLGWPCYKIDSSSVGSAYIHETGRKIAEMFTTAFQHAPSILLMDEMEAFLADREGTNSHHRIEEVAEFLRRIPEAVSKRVLIVGLTNRLDLIDSAILRRGRFDHVIEVFMPDQDEVLDLMIALLGHLPGGKDLDLQDCARRLCNRPLSDAAFVAREAARLTARRGLDKLEADTLDAALAAALDSTGSDHRMGFL